VHKIKLLKSGGAEGGGAGRGSNHKLGSPAVDFMSHANGPPSLDSKK